MWIVADEPHVPPSQVLRLLQLIKLGEMQSDGCNPANISWLERYEQVVKQRHLDGLKRANVHSATQPVYGMQCRIGSRSRLEAASTSVRCEQYLTASCTEDPTA
jgi:hypothetical protein